MVGPMKLCRLPLLSVLLLAFAAGLLAQGEPPASKAVVRKAIVATIEGQLAAFRAGDTAKALTFAAAAFRQNVKAGDFAKMVRDGYPEIWNNARAEFGLVRDDGSQALVNVQVFAKDKSSASYDYVLVKEEDGVWRIGAVVRNDPKPAEGA